MPPWVLAPATFFEVTTLDEVTSELEQIADSDAPSVDGDIKQMNELAEEIASSSQTIIGELRDRGAIRKKIKRNQAVGKKVEEALRDALRIGHGLNVERAPVGSDYSVEPENDFLNEEDREVILRVGKFYIEIKATIGQYVRMTDVQGKKARENPDCYALCVVALSDQEELIDKDSVQAKVRFVTDIGSKVEALVKEVELLEGSINGVLGRTGQIKVEIEDQKVKYRIEHTVWEAGISFGEAIRYFGGHE